MEKRCNEIAAGVKGKLFSLLEKAYVAWSAYRQVGRINPEWNVGKSLYAERNLLFHQEFEKSNNNWMKYNYSWAIVVVIAGA